MESLIEAVGNQMDANDEKIRIGREKLDDLCRQRGYKHILYHEFLILQSLHERYIILFSVCHFNVYAACQHIKAI